MKLQLTHDEVVQIVRSHFQLAKGVKVEIVDNTDSSDVCDLLKHIKIIHEAFPDWRCSQKIKACLALKREFGYGLADCKFIVEHPDEAVENLRTVGAVRQ